MRLGSIWNGVCARKNFNKLLFIKGLNASMDYAKLIVMAGWDAKSKVGQTEILLFSKLREFFFFLLMLASLKSAKLNVKDF